MKVYCSVQTIIQSLKIYYLNSIFSADDDYKVKFNVVASRSVEEPPTVDVTFGNGVQDVLKLERLQMNLNAPTSCSYIGRLQNNPSSSVAATGCLNKPGDRMELTVISNNNINKMFAVDFQGNTEVIKNPFGEEGFIL